MADTFPVGVTAVYLDFHDGVRHLTAVRVIGRIKETIHVRPLRLGDDLVSAEVPRNTDGSFHTHRAWLHRRFTPEPTDQLHGFDLLETP